MTETAAPPSIGINPPGTARAHALLVVDDEPEILDSLRHLFHRRYRVFTASGGQEALEILDQQDIHVILSDQRMPGMPGDQFLRAARERKPDAIRLLFTGYAEIQTIVDAVNQAGIFRYIHKPWEPGELELAIGQAAEQYEILAERRRLMVQLRDTNEQLTQANRDLVEADQLKMAFLEVASHEFNTPITLVQGLSGFLRISNPDRDPNEREIVDQISESASQLARLVANTLKLMRAGDYRNPLRATPTDLGRLLREVAAQTSPFAVARGLQFAISIPDNLGEFTIDADKIRDAVLNLLTNAIKFTPDGGDVSLTAVAVDDSARIVVADKGIGLEPRALAHLFEPFFTEFDPGLHSTGEFGFNKRGLGLGLSLVKRFVELHGGTVEAESTPGEGTTITLSLLRTPRPASDSMVDSANR